MMITAQLEMTAVCLSRYFCDENELDQVYSSLSVLEAEYPNFKKWFYGKVVPELRFGTREIIVAYVSNQIAGILILKDSNEKKICTLRVMPDFQHMGIGHAFMDFAINKLNCKHPLITVSDSHVSEFSNLFNEYGFVQTEVLPNYYVNGHSEYCFNGYLTEG